MLNIVWLVAAWGVAPWLPRNEVAQAYVLAVAVLIAGVAQVGGPAAGCSGGSVSISITIGRPPAAGVLQIGRKMAPMSSAWRSPRSTRSSTA